MDKLTDDLLAVLIVFASFFLSATTSYAVSRFMEDARRAIQRGDRDWLRSSAVFECLAIFFYIGMFVLIWKYNLEGHPAYGSAEVVLWVILVLLSAMHGWQKHQPPKRKKRWG